jgi:HD-GYP domain-containing protein (c-di-GMP phosphodiesterase class II)
LVLGLSAEDIDELRTLGLMHDIGKITLEDRLLDKPGKLSDSEYLEIQRHVETGYRILSSLNEFSSIAGHVLAHHERWDGTGYPNGLKGEEIPLEARIIAVADAYDAMTSDRPYRKALSEEAAVEEIKRNTGTQFDPAIVKAFVEKAVWKKVMA